MRNKVINNYKSNKFFSLLLIVGLLIMVIGVSYSYFAYYRTGLYTYTINGGKMNVIYSEKDGNSIQIDNAYPMSDQKAETNAIDFEFTVTGYNESEENIYYAIEIDYGSVNETKTRLLDSDMKLSLYENGEEVFKNEIFNNLNKQDIHYGYISYGTDETTPVTNTYLLKIWINDNVLITNTPNNLNTEGRSVYSTEEFANSYASYKVNVRADLSYDSIGYLTYDANGGEFTPSKTSLTTGKVTSQKPVLENKGFLGWSGTKNGEVEFKAGDIYTKDYDVLYAIYGDTRNVMDVFPSTITDVKEQITEVYFINDTQANIDTRYNASTIKADLTYNSQGSVKGCLEEDYLDEETSIQYYKLYVASEGTIYLTNCYAMFADWRMLENVYFDNVDTSMVEDMSYMFSTLSALDNDIEGAAYNDDVSGKIMPIIFVTEDEYLNYIISLDLSMFNTSNVNNMKYMFGVNSDNFYINCLENISVSSFDTSKVIDMSYMFEGCNVLEFIDVSGFDTSNVTDMSCMFEGCNVLEFIDVSSFDTSQVTTMKGMFERCNILETINISNFNTGKVTDMASMFDNCIDLRDLDLSSFNTSKVKDMSYMFYNCYNLTELDVSKFDTSNVVNMSSMFLGCTNLVNINVNNFNTSKVTNMEAMFEECSSLTKLDLSSWSPINVTTISFLSDAGMFEECINLKYLDISSFDFKVINNYRQAFYRMPVDATIYVKDLDAQSKILGVSTSYRPAWTTSNVIVKTA